MKKRKNRTRAFKEDPEEYALKFATTLNNLSLSYLNNGDLEKAEATQNESISIKTEYRGEDCIELAQSYNNMAIVKKDRMNMMRHTDIRRNPLPSRMRRIMRLIYIIWQEWKMPGEIMSKQYII